MGVFETRRARDLAANGIDVRVELLPRPDDAPGFQGVVRALRSLSDVALPRVLDGGVEGDRAFVVTEDFEGRSLSHWLAGHRTASTLPSFGASQRIIERIGAGVRFLHEARGLEASAHGGLCARNVLVRRVGSLHTVKLLGAGLSSLARGDAGSTVWGHLTPYLAPECDVSTATPTPSLDLFALAVLVVEVLTTHATPDGGAETWGALSRSRASTLRDRLAAQRPEVPSEVLAVLARALAPSPRERFSSAALLLRALRDAWTAAGRWDSISASEREPPDPSPESFERAAPALPRRARTSAEAPVGWQSAERAPAQPVTSQPVTSQPVAAAPSKPVAAPIDEEADRTEAIDVVSHHDHEDGADATDAMSRPDEIIAAVQAMRGAAAEQMTLGLDASSPFASSSQPSPSRAHDRTIAPSGGGRAERHSAPVIAVEPEAHEDLETRKVTPDEVARARRELAARSVVEASPPASWERTEAHSFAPAPQPSQITSADDQSGARRARSSWPAIAGALTVATALVVGAYLLVPR